MPYRAMLGLDRDGPDLYLVEMTRLREGPFLHSARTLASAAEGLDPTLLRRIAQSAAMKTVAAALPRAAAVQRELALPPLGPDETRAAIIAALEDQVPFAPAEICPAWIGGSGKGGVLTVTAAPRAQVEAIRDALSDAGLSPARLEIRTGAAAAAFCHGYREELAGRSAILVELRREESSLIMLREGSILYAKPLPGMGVGATGLDDLSAELQSTYALLRTRTDWREPENLYLTGSGAAQPAILQGLAAQLGVAPEWFRVARPRGLLRASGLAEPGPEYLVPAGLCLAALGLAAPGPDLLSGLARNGSGKRAALALPLGLSLLLSLAGLAVLNQTAAGRLEAARSWLAEYRGEAVELRRQKERAAEVAEQLTRLRTYGRHNQLYLDLLLALDGVMPAGTRIERLSLREGRVETLAGTTPSTTRLLQRLESHPVLARLSLQGPVVTRAEGGVTYESFTLAGPLAAEEVQP